MKKNSEKILSLLESGQQQNWLLAWEFMQSLALPEYAPVVRLVNLLSGGLLDFQSRLMSQPPKSVPCGVWNFFCSRSSPEGGSNWLAFFLLVGGARNQERPNVCQLLKLKVWGSDGKRLPAAFDYAAWELLYIPAHKQYEKEHFEWLKIL